MKKKFSCLLVLGIFCLFGLIKIVSADSGWGGSYGGSSSSSSSSGSSYYHHSSSSYTADAELSDVILVIVVLVILFIIVYGGKKKEQTSDYESRKTSYDIEKIKEVLPDFDLNEFRDQSYEIYKKIQIAWMDFDYPTLRKYTTDELYHSYQSQLTVLKAKKQKNIMKNFQLKDFKILDMEHDETHISLKVHMLISCNDYVVDKNEKVVRGTDHKKVIYDYEMTFTRSVEKKANKCPNCNAPLEEQHSNVCPYCDSPILGKHYDWILSKKEVKKQM